MRPEACRKTAKPKVVQTSRCMMETPHTATYGGLVSFAVLFEIGGERRRESKE